MGIIDIHTHIIFDIDDGADDSNMSLTLMGMEYEQGVTGIFCTNHSYGMEDQYREYHRRFDELSKTASDKYPGLSLYKGCEIFCYKDDMPNIISNIRNDIFPAMNGTQYVLLEFGSFDTAGINEMRYCVESVLNAGYIPIIAHVERYETIYDDALSNLIQLKELGCLTQINLYSVEQDHGNLGDPRKKLANLFLENRLVDFVGTDTHNLHYKSPEAAIGANVIRKKYGDEYADKILFGNAERLLI